VRRRSRGDALGRPSDGQIGAYRLYDLSLSSWRNYRFLSEGDEGKTLAKWVEFFGYDSGERGEAAITRAPDSGHPVAALKIVVRVRRR
jgi:hypothetical protein